MPTSNGIIVSPVSIEDVRKTIGSSSTDLGTLCTHTNINMWARHKPVDVDRNLGTRTLGVLYTKEESGYIDARHDFKTPFNDWGIIVVNADDKELTGTLSTQEMSMDIDILIPYIAKNYRYKRRSIGNIYRLTDFRGYCHVAKPCVKTGYDDSGKFEKQTDMEYPPVVIDFFFYTGNNGSLTWDDMLDFNCGGVPLRNMRLCCAVEGGEGLDIGNMSFSGPLGTEAANGSLSLNLNENEIMCAKEGNGGKYKAYFALSTSSDNTALFFPFFGLSVLDISLYLRKLFASLTLDGIGVVSGIGTANLNSYNLSDITYNSPFTYDVYENDKAQVLYAPGGNGVVLKITGATRSSALYGISPSLFCIRLNTGTIIKAAVQIVGPNATSFSSHPSTSTNTFTMAENSTYTFYVVAIDKVADATNEVQLSMEVAGRVQEGLSAKTGWMNIHIQ